jgi:hypothetical protein
VRVERYEGSAERSILIGMVTNDHVLGRIAPRWEPPGLFDSDHANLVGGWCVDFYGRYGKAPGRSVESYHRNWAEAQEGTDKAEAVRRLLGSLSEEYDRAEQLNADHLLDVAADHFDKVRMTRLVESVRSDLDRGDVKKARSRWDASYPLELGSDGWIDPLKDEEACTEAFASQGKSLLALKGGLAEFFGSTLERDGFVALLASEKRGKSYSLFDFVWRASQQKLRTAYFEVGDLSRPQVMRRLMRRAAMRPFKAGDVRWPVRMEVSEGVVKVEHEEITYPRPMRIEEAKAGLDKANRKLGDNYLRLSVHPNGSMSVPGIRSILSRWARDGWACDVVVIDYADILASPSAKIADRREQINQTWSGLRRLSQELHCLVLTATQADADSYDADLLRRSNFSEDKRKYAHVTGMFGLNQTDTEKKEGLYRLNWLVRREEEYSETEVCYVAACLDVCHPTVLSSFRGVT